MIPVLQVLDLALKHHRSGDLRQAEQLYRQVLQEDPHQVDAWHLLGVLAHQVGRNDLAVEYIRQVVLKKDRELGARYGLRYAEAYHYIGPSTDQSELEELIRTKAVPR